MRDHRIAFEAQSVDEGANAVLVFGIGAFEFADFALDQGLKLGGARQCAFDALAHRLDFAPYRLSKRGDPFMGVGFRLGQTHRRFGHGACGKPQFLGAANHHGESPDEKQRYDRDNGRQNQTRLGDHIVQGANGPQAFAIAGIAIPGAGADPQKGYGGGDPVNRGWRAAVEGSDDGATIAQAIVIGRGAGGRVRRRIGAFRARYRQGVARFAGQFIGGAGDLRFQIVEQIDAARVQVAGERIGKRVVGCAGCRLRGVLFGCHVDDHPQRVNTRVSCTVPLGSRRRGRIRPLVS
ncbi:MAG: hypothetical protein IPL47_17935 [Phyllobacteriaceae bacterium]|nr:hypothetical protein [Phyllobacteriaceae bacterium]